MATQPPRRSSTPPSSQHSTPPDVERDYQPSRVRPEASQEEACQQAAGDQASTEKRVEPGRLFAEALAFMNANEGCNMNLMLAPADGGDAVRLTITGQHRSGGAEGEDAPDGPPFKPITLVGRPEELDDPANGLEQFLRERTDQVQTLTEVREQADEAHEQAVKAEKRRKEKAEQKKAENSENGPLFSGDDSSDDDSGGDEGEDSGD